MITTNDLPQITGPMTVVELDSFETLKVERFDDGRYYAHGGDFDTTTANAQDMADQLNRWGAVIVGWE